MTSPFRENVRHQSDLLGTVRIPFRDRQARENWAVWKVDLLLHTFSPLSLYCGLSCFWAVRTLSRLSLPGTPAPASVAATAYTMASNEAHFELDWLKAIKVKDVPVRRKGHVVVLGSRDSVVHALKVRTSGPRRRSHA